MSPMRSLRSSSQPKINSQNNTNHGQDKNKIIQQQQLNRRNLRRLISQQPQNNKIRTRRTRQQKQTHAILKDARCSSDYDCQMMYGSEYCCLGGYCEVCPYTPPPPGGGCTPDWGCFANCMLQDCACAALGVPCGLAICDFCWTLCSVCVTWAFACGPCAAPWCLVCLGCMGVLGITCYAQCCW